MNYAYQRNPDDLLRLAGFSATASAAEEARFLDALPGMTADELGTLVVIMGGFRDGRMGRAYAVAVNYPAALRARHRVFYRQHQEAPAVRQLVQLYAARGQEIMLIGHSWGADSLVNAVARRTDAPIRLLGTLDPVSRKGPPKAPLDNVALWLNAYVDYRTADLFDRSNIIARIGGPWEAVAVAHHNEARPVPHHDAQGLFAGEIEKAVRKAGAEPLPPQRGAGAEPLPTRRDQA